MTASIAARRVAPPRFWRDLVASIEDEQVIPIIGSELVTVETADGHVPLTTHIARQVEAALELEPAPEVLGLADVAARYLSEVGSQGYDAIYKETKYALDATSVAIPEALSKLAQIRGFKLFVTTTFDDLLVRAIDAERHDGQRDTKQYAFSPMSPDDFERPIKQYSEPVVYHLLGRASVAPKYAISEEDTLEFLHAITEKRPERLLEAFRSHSLLVLGTGYSDWLARFFLRVAKGQRLLFASSGVDVVAGRPARDDALLREFLDHFSPHTTILGNATDFVDELSVRWEEHATKQRISQEGDRLSPTDVAEMFNQPPPGSHAVFVSYASEDRDVASALAVRLREARLPVWFDRIGGLRGGDSYRATIERRIEEASLFIPVMSRRVVTNEPRFFRKEWEIARERAMSASQTLPFVMPVRVGDVDPNHPNIPKHISSAHWVETSGGTSFDDCVQRVLELFRKYQLAIEGGR